MDILLNNRIYALLRIMKTDYTGIAEYAGCSSANLSRAGRLRVNSSVIRKNSTLYRLANGIYGYAEGNGMLPEILGHIKCGETDPEAVKTAILEWLISDEVDNSIPETAKLRHFGETLSSMLKITEMSASRLSRAAGVDASYISRLRSGKRVPKSSSGIMPVVCTVIYEQAKVQGKLGELGRLIGVSEDKVSPPELLKYITEVPYEE